MKVRVLIEFRDKDDYAKVYAANSVVEFDKDRSRELLALGLVEELKETTTRKPKKANESI
jgi:hypothetical protein